MEDKHTKYMQTALKYAQMAYSLGEVPVGAIVVHNDTIIGYGYNLRERDKSSLAHAEIIAIDMACKKLGGWRLEDTTLYVTLEPCPMCSGAIINSRIPTVIYGASDPKSGALGSKINLNDYGFNHKPEIITGILKEECETILKDFFKELRMSK